MEVSGKLFVAQYKIIFPCIQSLIPFSFNITHFHVTYASIIQVIQKQCTNDHIHQFSSAL